MPDEAAERAAVVAAARAWCGTPYHNCADKKGVGVDCGMLLVRVFVDLGLIEPLDPRPYNWDWHLHNAEEKYLGFVQRFGREVARTPKDGDVALFRYGRCYSHGAIIVKAAPLTIVHAFAKAHYVVEDKLSNMPALLNAKPRYFSYWPD